jgi:hypothetical protein
MVGIGLESMGPWFNKREGRAVSWCLVIDCVTINADRASIFLQGREGGVKGGGGGGGEGGGGG